MVSLRISDLTHEFDDREVFRSVDFEFDGTRLAVTGPNGSGKSTLLRILAGLLTPTSGEVAVSIDGACVSHDALRDVVGLVAPDVRLYGELSARENLRFLAGARASEPPPGRILEVLEEVGLAERADDPVHELSSGLRQRACFAAAMLHGPRLLLLDEPSTNLDEDGVEMIHSVIERQAGWGMVVLATNNPTEAITAQARLDLGERR